MVDIGCGIETADDVTMIESLVNALAGAQTDDGGGRRRPIVVECVTPNAECASMKSETAAYKAMSMEEKDEATRSRLMGPGKMAKALVVACSVCCHNQNELALNCRLKVNGCSAR